jgi:transposase-like protein
VELPDRLRRPRAKDELRAAAVEMRQAGATYDQIAAELGVSTSSCSLWLRDVDDASAVALEEEPSTGEGRREQARQLRRDGALLRETAAALDVSTQSAFRWTRGLPVPDRARHGGDAAHVRAMAEQGWGAFRRQRDTAAQQRKPDAAREIGVLDDRTLLVLGAVAYWCEGGKSKPWRPQGKWTSTNSDPVLMRLMVR